MKGMFIPEITVEMFRNGCLESIEALMAEGEVYDIEYDPKSAQPDVPDANVGELISRQWLMECVNEGWIKFDTEKDENRFIHLVRDIAPSVQPRKGKWIEASEDWRNQITWWQCSECGTPSSIKSNFCPNCGSYNGGEQDG